MYIIKEDLSKVSNQDKQQMLSDIYKSRVHESLDWDNLSSMSQKVQWLKLYYNHPDIKKCCDKISFKKYIQDNFHEIVKTLPILTIWDNPEDVDLTQFYNRKAIIKSNCSCCGWYIKKIDSNLSLNKLKELEQDIKQNWFNQDNLLTNSFCSGYQGIQPKVFVEELLESSQSIKDYKFFCFSGSVNFITVLERGEEIFSSPITYFDLDWNQLDITQYPHPTKSDFKKPYHLQEMINVAKEISKRFPFVRVDFFDTENDFYISELTFYPSGGLDILLPREFDYACGKLIDLEKCKYDG